jgi:c-di-GMP-specific phosphodiesterase
MNQSQLRFTKLDFEQAFAAGEITHYFQPLVNITSKAVLSFEALARWNHPKLGLLNSGLFIEDLIEQGFASDLTKVAAHNVLHAYRDAKNQGLKPLPITVNATAAEFETPAMFQWFIGFVLENNSPPDLIEMLEWQPGHDLEALGAAVKALRLFGVKVYADDFGDAYASFRRMMNLPFSGIKLDAEYANVIHDNRTARAIVKSLVMLTGELDIEFVIEGIETQEQADAFSLLGVHIAQGIHFYPPMHSDLALKLLKPI